MRDIAILVFAAIGAITAIIKVLPEFGVDLRTIGRRKVPLDQIKTRPRARAWVVLVVALISLGLSLGAFYYFFRPRTVEKNVEKKAQLGAGELQPRSRSGLEYVWVPPGTFTMGCSRGDTWCDPPNAKHYEEKPAHQVSLTNGFWIGQTEVTVDAYRRYVAVTGRQMPTTPRFNLKWADGHQPIVNVNWEEARHFCEWDD